jgi:hypothetical protein
MSQRRKHTASCFGVEGPDHDNSSCMGRHFTGPESKKRIIG